MKIVVLGAGRVGSAIVRDLLRDGAFELRVADASPAALEPLSVLPGVQTVRADLRDSSELSLVLRGGDLVVDAVPGEMGFVTVQRVLQAGLPLVDISFFPEDAFLLDELARARGVPAVVDAGIAPGMDNLIAGHLSTRLDRVDRFLCLVGGLPAVRTWPWEYKAGFSPADVLEEYTRPARYVAGGKLVTLPALSEPELLEFPGVGTLEAFNTDGLRSLIHTLDAPDKKEKTLRYPGHIEKMRMLRDAGFFDKTIVALNGVQIRPLDLTSRLLFDAWHLRDEDEDLTVMRVEVEGQKDGRTECHVFDLLDRRDPSTKTSSMARTTGYTCTAVTRLVASGKYREPGIAPLEIVGRHPGCYESVIADLAARNIVFRESMR